MDFLAQVAETVSSHLFHSGFHRVVALPPEIFVVQLVVGVEDFEELDQRLWRELQGVDVRVRRCDPTVIGSAVNHWNDVVIHNLEKFLGDVG